MNISVNIQEIVQKWPRVEVYQNSTLRYSPPRNFPEYLTTQIGRSRIMRTFITLDEYWDYKTDTTYPDYAIGVRRYPLSDMHYPYDWERIAPAPGGTRFVDYLTSHAAQADELLLNVRRLEREVSDGIISYEAYEALFEKAVEYCKNLAPNIRYIECCNEVEGRGFGRLTTDEYYKIYRCGYRAIRRLNEKHRYPLPLQYGGYAKTYLLGNQDRWDKLLEDLSADDAPEKMCDFYSIHYYAERHNQEMVKTQENPVTLTMTPFECLQLFLYLHNRKLQQLGLPEKPIFINEVGFTATTGVLTDSLKNASGVISMMIGAVDLPNAYLFPWCTFHNPKLQISFTQFVLLEDGSYASTPNGNAMIMLHRLAENQLAVQGDCEHCSVATRDEDRITILCTNPNDRTDEFHAVLHGLDGKQVLVREYLCDSYRNNRVTGEDVRDLHITREQTLEVADGSVALHAVAEPYAFVFWEIFPI